MRHVMRQNRDGEIRVVDIRPGDAQSGAEILRSWRWATLLTWFMRSLSFVWFVKGLYGWAIVLGAFPRLGWLPDLPRPMQAAWLFLAPANIVAAVGLWLAVPWGGVVWLATVIVEVCAMMLGFALYASRPLAGGLDVVLVAAYFVLLWLASEERG